MRVPISDITDKISRNLQRSEDYKDSASSINEKSLLKLDLNQPAVALISNCEPRENSFSFISATTEHSTQIDS